MNTPRATHHSGPHRRRLPLGMFHPFHPFRVLRRRLLPAAPSATQTGLTLGIGW